MRPQRSAGTETLPLFLIVCNLSTLCILLPAAQRLSRGTALLMSAGAKHVYQDQTDRVCSSAEEGAHTSLLRHHHCRAISAVKRQSVPVLKDEASRSDSSASHLMQRPNLPCRLSSRGHEMAAVNLPACQPAGSPSLRGQPSRLRNRSRSCC